MKNICASLIALTSINNPSIRDYGLLRRSQGLRQYTFPLRTMQIIAIYCARIRYHVGFRRAHSSYFYFFLSADITAVFLVRHLIPFNLELVTFQIKLDTFLASPRSESELFQTAMSLFYIKLHRVSKKVRIIDQ